MTASRSRTAWLLALAVLALVPMSLRAALLATMWVQGAYRHPMPVGGLQLGTGASALLCVAASLSIIVDWFLMLGWIRRGDAWLAARATWIKVVALIAPLVSLWISVQGVAASVGGHADGVDAPVVAAHPWVTWVGTGLQIVFAALVALLVITAVRAAQRGD